MIESMRRALIEDSLILAVQQGKISNRDRGRVTEVLRLNNFELGDCIGMNAELRASVLSACPMLAESAPAVSTTTPVTTPPTKSRHAAEEISYGFTREH